ncbi:glycosaminoglycan xylosylkinase homolog [Anthonomus grandis grandis]|uniref:glycosaminoglycan xylosylkinase homolog n=1 Tax=Anthonomus grandis grandis TaxID=2921223 RepID=UPI002165BBE3|nr:glycosaminoglycan xylosylkinase homolog [Anthonomus grandis grandis]
MFPKKPVKLVTCLVVALFFFILNYLLKLLPVTDDGHKYENKIDMLIFEELKHLPKYHINEHEDTKAAMFLEAVKSAENVEISKLNLKELWDEANLWPSVNQLTNITSPSIGSIMYALKHARITKADLDTRGTQLKLLLTLTGGQLCVFKPKWYEKEKVIEGPVYSGKDRYGAEIVAFYLSILLNKPLTPISVQRTISLKYDILPVATKRLLNTTFLRNNRTCIYGKCFYCRKEDPICEDEHNFLTGAVIFNVKKSFSNYRSPWQRTYKKTKRAQWESDLDYCKMVKTKLQKRRILDLIDTAIFDFLIQNGDRHHYETFEDTVVWIDNGKGLGNPFVQHLDILAPLYQCCMLRKKTWKSLQNLSGGNLTKYMRLMPDVQDVLTELHLQAIEKRLLLVFATVEYCNKKNNKVR